MRKILIYSFLFFCAIQAYAQKNYIDGIFILNEDWYGHNNSTINFLDPRTGEFDYLLIQNNAENRNRGLSLGCTSQYGTIYGDNIYIVSKQDQDPGELGGTFTGGRVVVADAQTMGIKKSIPVIFEIDGKPAADGRSFVGVDENKGYIGTSNGIYVFDLQSFEIGKRIEGSENPLIQGGEENANGVGALYQNQIGMMIRTHDYVFAIQQDKGMLVIDPILDEIVEIIEGCFSTMAQSKDGTIWVGKNANMDYQHYPYGNVGATGECWDGSQLLKLSPATLKYEVMDMPEDIGINQIWYAWTAGSLTASAKQNVLYFTFNPNRWSWFTCSLIYKYDIDSDEFMLIMDTSIDERFLYGAAIRINPADDKLYATLYLDNINQTYFFYQLDEEGVLLNEYSPIKRYWFPAMFIFPDNHAPVADEFLSVSMDNNEVLYIDLEAMASDEDNLDAAITKRVIYNDNELALSARVSNNKLELTALRSQRETANITIRFNSNGKIADRVLTVNLTGEGTPIYDIAADEYSVYPNPFSHYIVVNTLSDGIAEIYNMQGQKVLSVPVRAGSNRIDTASLPKGIYVIKTEDGRRKKIEKM